MNKYFSKTKGLLFCTLSLLSCGGIGYASWYIGAANDKFEINIDTSFGEVIGQNYKDSAFYVENSEEGFSYYTQDNIYNYTDTSLSLKIAVYPSKVASYFVDDTYVSFSVYYSYDKGIDFDIFSNSNSNIEAPSFFTCSLEDNFTYYLHSSELTYTKSEDPSNSSKYLYKLNGEILLYSKNKPSLYSLCSNFTSSNSYYIFDVDFKFNILNSVEIANDFNYLVFGFQTSLEGINL